MHSYIVIVSPSYGGAEKRFFDIFRSLRSNGSEVMMIAPSSLVQRLLADYPDPGLRAAVISLDLAVWSPGKFIRSFYHLLSTLPRGARFHYPMNCLWPLHLGRGDRVSMSVTNCTKAPKPSLSNRTGLWTWASFFFVNKIDVLSPAIFRQMASYRMAHKMSLTPGGTFLEIPEPTGKPRRPTAVLLSRLVNKKGIDDLLDVLPQVWAVLRERVRDDFGVEIAGYGPLEQHVIARIKALADSGVPVSFIGYADARELLSQSAVALSMQEVTNYPSRVVAEALVLGCPVIVRNTGDSMQFGSDIPGLFYCQSKLDPLELAAYIEKNIKSIFEEGQYSSNIRIAATEKFSSMACLNYFKDLIGIS